MDYAAHYDRLIARARSRILVGYRERHHVIPRCIGGGNETENLVYLTAGEHYVAHQLLVKIYPGDRGITHAASMMANTRAGNKFYGWLRKRYADVIREEMTGKKRAPFSAEHRARMGATKIGNKNCVGRVMSAQTRSKMSATKTGRKLSQQHRAKLSVLLLGNKRTLGMRHSAESREKMSVAAPKTKSPEHRAKISLARLAYWKRRRDGISP